MKLVIGLGALALIVVGVLFLSSPPSIAVAPEHIFSIGSIPVTNTMLDRKSTRLNSSHRT